MNSKCFVLYVRSGFVLFVFFVVVLFVFVFCCFICLFFFFINAHFKIVSGCMACMYKRTNAPAMALSGMRAQFHLCPVSTSD